MNSNYDMDSLIVAAEVLKRFFLGKCRFTEGINLFETAILLLEGDTQSYKLKNHIKAHLAGLKLTTSERDSAHQLAKEAFIALNSLKDLQGVMLPLSILGIYEASNGKYTSAQVYFRHSVILATKFSDIDQATYLANLAVTEQCLGYYEKAEHYNEEALLLARKFRLSSQELTLCNNLASLMLAKKDTVRAIMYLEDSLNLAQELNSKSMIPYIECNLGNVYFQLHDYEQAIQHYDKALEQAKTNEQNDIEILIYAEIGRVHLANKQVYSAQSNLIESLQLGFDSQHIQYSLKALNYWAQYLIIEDNLIEAASILSYVQVNSSTSQEDLEIAEKALNILSKRLPAINLKKLKQKATTYETTTLLEEVLSKCKDSRALSNKPPSHSSLNDQFQNHDSYL